MRQNRLLALLGVTFLLTFRLYGQSIVAVAVAQDITGPGVYSLRVVGYSQTGVGWRFTPSQDLMLTDFGLLGGSNINNLNPFVRLWDEHGNVLASCTDFASPLDDRGISYTSVTPILLTAGSAYLIDLTTDTSTLFCAFFHGSSYLDNDFQIASQLTQFSASTLLAPGQLDPGYLGASYIYLGPTFRFTGVPEPVAGTIMWVGIVAIWSSRCSRSRKRPCRDWSIFN